MTPAAWIGQSGRQVEPEEERIPVTVHARARQGSRLKSAGFLSSRLPDAQALLPAFAAVRRQPARRKTMPFEIAACCPAMAMTMPGLRGTRRRIR
jgi:hypothetical protein